MTTYFDVFLPITAFSEDSTVKKRVFHRHLVANKAQGLIGGDNDVFGRRVFTR